MLLEERPEDEAEKQRRRLATELDQDIAEDAEDGDAVDVEVVRSDDEAATLAKTMIAGKSTR